MEPAACVSPASPPLSLFLTHLSFLFPCLFASSDRMALEGERASCLAKSTTRSASSAVDPALVVQRHQTALRDSTPLASCARRWPIRNPALLWGRQFCIRRLAPSKAFLPLAMDRLELEQARSCCGAHTKVIDDVWPMTQSWHPLLSRDEISERILCT